MCLGNNYHKHIQQYILFFSECLSKDSLKFNNSYITIILMMLYFLTLYTAKNSFKYN